MTDDTFDFGRFDALTFDCYGTLIDWEAGLRRRASGPARPARRRPGPRCAARNVRRVRGRGRAAAVPAYRDVLAAAARATCATYGVEPTDDELADSADRSSIGPPSPTRTTRSPGSRPASGWVS